MMRGRAPEISGASAFLNTERVALSDFLHTKVTLLLFWNSCGVSSLRALRHARALYAKYAPCGLEVIGVHTPRYSFEEDPSYVQNVLTQHHISFPVALDTTSAVGSAYTNEHWPTVHLIHSDGAVVHDQIGETGWDSTEEMLRSVLREHALLTGHVGSVLEDAHAPLFAPESPVQRTIFLGEDDRSLEVDWSTILGDEWTVAPDYIESRVPGASISLTAEGADVYLVASTASAASGDLNTRSNVLLNGAHPGKHAGSSLDGGGILFCREPGLFPLLHSLPEGPHYVDIVTESPGTRLYHLVVE